MRNRKLYLNCLRQTAKVYRRGTFDHWTAVACLATCIDIQMREDPADAKTGPEVRDPAAVPALNLLEPLSEDDRILQELYPEAIEFWALRYGQPRLMK
ncbi:MAG: hypothetical protein ACJ8BF_08275 [Gemmatimonadales bacterium]